MTNSQLKVINVRKGYWKTSCGY